MSESPLETIALVGNPNAGKTTLFNALTKAVERTGNYAGVTVAVKSGEMFTPHGQKLRVLDLPAATPCARIQIRPTRKSPATP